MKMNFNLMISGFSGAIIGGLCYFVLSGYPGGTGEGLGQYLLWLFALAAIACLLAAGWGLLQSAKAPQ
jgi:hypothetical protein